jgi:hypothetical protein
LVGQALSAPLLDALDAADVLDAALLIPDVAALPLPAPPLPEPSENVG